MMGRRAQTCSFSASLNNFPNDLVVRASLACRRTSTYWRGLLITLSYSLTCSSRERALKSIEIRSWYARSRVQRVLTSVSGSGTNHPVALVLLDSMAYPTDGPAQSEQREG